MACDPSQSAIDLTVGDGDITRTDVTDADLLPPVEPMLKTESTHINQTGSISKGSKRSVHTETSSVREAELELIKRAHELAQRELELKYERKKLRVERKELGRQNASLLSKSNRSESTTSSVVVSNDECRQSIEKCLGWVGQNRNEFESVPPGLPPTRSIRAATERSRHDHSLMNPNLGLDEFVDLTLQQSVNRGALNLTRAQVNARQVISKELPNFAGDPRDWPIFIAKFRESSQQCGFTATENLDRLSKSLKGEAYEAVRTDLTNPEALGSVIATLKMMFGRPETVYQALISHVKESPPVKVEKLETLITFAMRVKSMYDTLRAAEMTDYLNHPSLLNEFAARLPPMLSYRWADYLQLMSESRVKVTMEHFSGWLRTQIEKLGRVASNNALSQPTPTSQSQHPPKNNSRNSKKSNNAEFQGVHQAENTNSSKHCKFCDETGHLASECDKFKALSVSKRWNMARQRYMCVCCLGKHILRNCGSIVNCGINGCVQPHHKLLHSEKGEQNEGNSKNDKDLASTSKAVLSHQEATVSETSSQIQDEVEAERVLVHAKKGSKFQIVPIYLSNGNDKRIKTYAFLDSGSEITIVNDNLIRKLGITGPTEELKLKWSNQCSRTEPKSQRVQVYITGMQEEEMFLIKNARTVQTLQLPLQSIESEKLNQFKHLKGIPFEEYTDACPEILIGLDNHFLMSPIEVIEGELHDPVAIRTRLGWTVFGNSDTLNREEHCVNMHSFETSKLHELVDRYFSLENIGIQRPTQIVESNEDARARKILKATISQNIDGRYEVGLLWRTNEITMPNSLPMAKRRLQCFEGRLKKNPQLRAEVNRIIREYHDVGYLERLDEQQTKNVTNRTWYLPIFVVSNPNKPGKERIVWDAAAKVNGASLNSNLLTGPDLNASLVSTLFKFREKRYAIGGDIQQMFHQIRVRHDDQDSQRCLWREDETKPICVSKMTVATFGAACSPSIAQYVKNFHASKYAKKYPRAVEAIIERHYVDDYVDSFETWQQGKKIAEQVAQIHMEGGFFIRRFVSNEPRMIVDLPREATNPDKRIEQHDQDTKILGMWWETKRDVLRYRINEDRIGKSFLDGTELPTKRKVLSTVMMTFDPLGLLGFFTLKGKLVVKSIWRTQIDWDDQIQEEQKNLWLDWIEDLKNVSNHELRRCYFSESGATSFELHVFVDAGENAAAAVAYVVGRHSGIRETMIVSSKTKVAPNKCISIPRMELQAAVIGIRLSMHVKEEHSICFEKCVFWTDSRNVLCWIRSPKQFKVFVAHRISEIRESSKPLDWRYVPTKLNPADHATKWKSWLEKTPADWFTGPEFIRNEPEEWPAEPENLPTINEDILEVRCNVTIYDASTSACPDITRFSSWTRFVRTQAWVLRIIYRDQPILVLNKTEIDRARTHIIREIQMLEFGQDYQQLKKGKLIHAGSRLRQYSPFMDKQGIVRMKSRLQEADFLQYDQRNPIILPSKHPITRLIIHDVHVKYWHANYNTVLNELRQIYVIPHARTILKSVRAACQTCKIRSARPEVPEMSALPRSRLAAYMRPFTYVGVDCFGPMLVKVHRRSEKRWGTIFTCMTTRAIHIELISSLSSDAFILALTCFIGRRGHPAEVFCDNGTNFRGADNELTRVMVDNMEKAVSEKFAEIKFKFNPPGAPHMGGAWERLIRSIKSGLRHLLNGNVTSEELLRTSLIDIEMLVNSRPLTYVATDENSHEALTPNHFLLGHSSGAKPYGNFCDDPEVLKKEWKRQQVITQMFWQRWTNEYLPEISKRAKWYDPVEPIRKGDVVAVVNSSIPNSWQLGRVTDVVKSKDGSVRQAEVHTNGGVLRRPSSKLAVLVREELRDGISSAGGSVKN